MSVVRDSMTHPAIFVDVSASTGEVLALVEQRSVSAVPVLREGRLVGIVSTTDLVRDLASPRDGDLPRTAADCMRSPVVTTNPGASLVEATRAMVSAKVHRLVVVEDDRVVGVLSTRDVLPHVEKARSARKLSEIMTRDVLTIELDTTVDAAVEKLSEANVHGLVVVDGEHPIGVFTHAEALASRRLPAALRARPVEEVMSYETICFAASTPVYRAAAQALRMNVRRLLVVENREVVGILSCLDLARELTL